MYHYIEDKVFQKRLKRTCADIINRLVQRINHDFDSPIEVEAHLVGSGARNLITQNADCPVDLDYNLCIVRTQEFLRGREVKEYVRKQFNRALDANGWGDCQDSTSALTTEQRVFRQGNKTAFSIDLAMISYINGRWQRLIHNKTGFVSFDEYYWNEVPYSQGLEGKVRLIKENDLWNEVRTVYLNKKNQYLCRNDYNHPSFVVYIETINEVYNKRFTKKKNGRGIYAMG